MVQEAEGVQRADAKRNRERIIEAAVEVFSSDGGASLSAIGKLAGVGQGTLYRHFPDRESLVWAIYEREVDDLVARAEKLLKMTTPTQALRQWMSHLARFALTKAGLGAAMNEPIVRETKAARPGYARIVRVIEDLLAAGRATGDVRADVTVEDFLSLIAGLWQIGPGPEGEARAQRLLDLVVLAIRADSGGVAR